MFRGVRRWAIHSVRQAFRATQILGVLSVLWFAASTAGAVARVTILDAEESGAVEPHTLSGSDVPDEDYRIRASSPYDLEQTAEAITERNVFCPTCVDEPETPAPTPGKAGSNGMLAPGETESALPLALVATMQAVDPTHSIATVAYEQSGRVGVFAAGDSVMPGVHVAAVGNGIVHLRRGSGLEYLSLPEPDERSKRGNKHRKKRKKRRRKRKSKREIDGAREAIECQGDHSCTIDRKFVNKLIRNPALLVRQARLRPSRKNGKTRGFKVYGVRRGTLPRLLGLKNGDLITTINGEDLRSMDDAMKMYARFRNASNLRVTVKRRGKVIEKNFDIQ